MAIQHHKLPVLGLQFHPESILTEHGYALLAAFLLGRPLPAASVAQHRERAGQGTLIFANLR